jgi:hypothetical protein
MQPVPSAKTSQVFETTSDKGSSNMTGAAPGKALEVSTPTSQTDSQAWNERLTELTKLMIKLAEQRDRLKLHLMMATNSLKMQKPTFLRQWTQHTSALLDEPGVRVWLNKETQRWECKDETEEKKDGKKADA